MWEAIADWAVHTTGGRDVALEACGLVMELINRGSTVAARAYLDEEQFLAVEGDRVRRDLLEDLIAGREPAPGPRLTAATKAGLHPDTPCAVVVAVPAGPVGSNAATANGTKLILWTCTGGANQKWTRT
ncbi:RICIN domain-containing protein [Streptomyces caniscabiei]|uniref:RICIN domain-containing protein n=1 Tax=Streptomyces caniscabiei TaxID=2746961 RepID=UPI000765BD1D|nr:RICIN domain-containing protein [Streptomyces caniscabiei]